MSTTTTTTTAPAEHWDIEIKPKMGWFDLRLADVWHYRDLMMLFVRRDFVAQYKQTILGPLWHFIQPILTSIMFLLVFTKIARIPTDGVDPVVFYMSGNILWSYFSNSLTATSSTFTANASIFGKVYFPRLVLPISIVMSNMVKFGIQLLLLFATMIYSHFVNGFNYHITVLWLGIPLMVVMMAGVAMGLGIIISALTTKYRDFTVLINFAVQLLMYLTPIIYPLSYLKGKSYGVYVDYNPLTYIVETFKYCILGQGTFSIGGMIYSVVFMFILLLIGSVIFTKVEKTFMDTV
jgi:lipopolysaccharide transport system permease protein